MSSPSHSPPNAEPTAQKRRIPAARCHRQQRRERRFAPAVPHLPVTRRAWRVGPTAEIGAEQHPARRRRARAPAAAAGRADRAAPVPPRRRHDRHQHRERRAVGGGGKADQQHQSGRLASAQRGRRQHLLGAKNLDILAQRALVARTRDCRRSSPASGTPRTRYQGRSMPLRLSTSCAVSDRRKLTSARAVAASFALVAIPAE
jgi:hypothetical protein